MANANNDNNTPKFKIRSKTRPKKRKSMANANNDNNTPKFMIRSKRRKIHSTNKSLTTRNRNIINHEDIDDDNDNNIDDDNNKGPQSKIRIVKRVKINPTYSTCTNPLRFQKIPTTKPISLVSLPSDDDDDIDNEPDDTDDETDDSDTDDVTDDDNDINKTINSNYCPDPEPVYVINDSQSPQTLYPQSLPHWKCKCKKMECKSKKCKCKTSKVLPHPLFIQKCLDCGDQRPTSIDLLFAKFIQKSPWTTTALLQQYLAYKIIE